MIPDISEMIEGCSNFAALRGFPYTLLKILLILFDTICILFFLSLFMQELFEHGGRSCNELVVVLERCVGVCWQGLHPNAYLIHRLYDLPPHSSPSVPSCTAPAFSNFNTYPLVVTADLIEYLKVSSLWVYMIDDSEKQSPTNFLAKTPVPLQALITGKPIKGKCNIKRTY